MVDLYRTLGVDRKASRKQIRDAYREKAKTAHPDTGGSPESFALVKRAHDVLSDEERRARYDANGSTDDPKRDNPLAEVVQVLSQLLDAVMGSVLKRNGEPTEYDLINDMKIALGADIHTLEENMTLARKAKKKIEKMSGRFKVKKGENYLESIVEQKVQVCQDRITAVEKQLDLAKRSMDMLRGFEFKYDARGENASPTSYNLGDFVQMALNR